MKQNALHTTKAVAQPANRWVRLSRQTATPELIEAINTFEPLDFPAGKAAAGFLKDEAVVNSTMTKTHLLVAENRVEGFISLCSGSVKLSERSIRSLGLRTTIRTMPAIVLTWIARHRGSSTTGLELVETAFGLARESAENVGVAAFVLDPWDAKVADIWRNAPYPFRDSEQKRKGKPPRLWTPLDPD
ncbi:MAG TPA: hypothetical protein VFM94_03500 [Solirubrobacterales bacterium]|nr:hypothetical protein [Solirubrobacterales bacterium]